MKMWIVLWGDPQAGYDDDVHVFSSECKVYDYIHKELTRQLELSIENNFPSPATYQEKYERTIKELGELFDSDYIFYSVPDLHDYYYEVKQVEVDS